MSNHTRLYRNACLWAVGISLLWSAINIPLILYGFDLDFPGLEIGYYIVYMPMFLGELAACLVSQEVSAESWILVYFIIWPLCTCIINTAIALSIAFIIARLRDRKRRKQPHAA